MRALAPALAALLATACGSNIELGIDTFDKVQLRQSRAVVCTPDGGDDRLYVLASGWWPSRCDNTDDSGLLDSGADTGADTGTGTDPTGTDATDTSCAGLSTRAQAQDCTGFLGSDRSVDLGLWFDGWESEWPMDARLTDAWVADRRACGSPDAASPDPVPLGGGTAEFTRVRESRTLWVGLPGAHGVIEVDVCH